MHSLETILKQICKELQIPSTKHDLAEKAYSDLAKKLDADDNKFKPWGVSIYPQGSFAIGTTVKPLKGEEYDVDLVCELQKLPGTVSQADLHNAFVDEIGKIYGTDKVEKKKRCVRVVFKNDFHMDILPAKPDFIRGGTCILVPDKELKEWKPSNPKEYANLFARQSQNFSLVKTAMADEFPDEEAHYEKKPLQNTIQLIKRWRDVIFENEEYSPRSIVLNTLIMNTYNSTASVNSTFYGAISAMTDMMSNSSIPLRVINPTNPQEVFSEKWISEPKGYYLFQSKLLELKKEWEEIVRETNIISLSKRLSRIFEEKVVASSMDKISKLRTQNNTKCLNITSAGTLTSAAGVLPGIPKHKFYGEEEK